MLGHRVRGIAIPDDATVQVGDWRDEDALSAAMLGVGAVVLTADDDVGNLHTAVLARTIDPEVRVVMRAFDRRLRDRVESRLPGCVVLSPSELAAPSFLAACRNPPGRRPLARWRHRLLYLGPPLLFVLATLIVAEVFAASLGLSLINAVYFTIATVTSTGYGDINLLAADWKTKLFGVGVMLFGIVLTAALAGLIANLLVTRSSESLTGARVRSMSGHAVVCGLGSLGYSIAVGLAELGWPVVAIEQDPAGQFVAAARRAGVLVLNGSAVGPGALETAAAARCTTLFAVTDDDAVNLQIALDASSVSSTLDVIVRVFDGDLAATVGSVLDHLTVLSMAHLASPFFTRAALDGQSA